MVDLSESMMSIAKERMDDSCRIKPNTLIADATALPFPDASFDRYICNMTVHYAPDADAFLREAARVLAPNGVAGFTVWGHEHQSPAFTILPSIKKQLGLMDPSTAPARSSFHMGEDDAALRQRVLAAGFGTCVLWHAHAVVEAISAEAYAETMIKGSHSTNQELLTWPEEKQMAFRLEVVNAANDLLQRGEPLCLDVCYCIARK
jgi:SAM-dependent methyltransferase